MIPIRKKYVTKIFIPLFILCVTATVYLFFLVHFENNTQSEPMIDRSVLDSIRLQDNPELYSMYNQGNVIDVYVTVYGGVDAKTGKSYTFDEMNTIRLAETGEPSLDASVKIEDPSSGEVLAGSDKDTPNCEISLRGESSMLYNQKSYKIKLFDGQGSFRGQTTLNLNKHISDTTLIRQKFCFDYMAILPDMVSLQTTFIRLYVKDATKRETSYKSYGLYTHVEQPNKDFLRAHGLDPNGAVYKPNDFEFILEDAFLKDGRAYDEEALSKVISARCTPDDEKLLRMLKDVNDPSLDFNKVFQKYFDQENYLTWIAMNILLDNYDTMSRNYLLYCPSYSDKWYFLPWDYDKAMQSDEEIAGNALYHLYGLERYWGNVLHKRFFKNTENLKLLDEKIRELKEIMTREQTDQFVNAYLPIAYQSLSEYPDRSIYGTSADTASRIAVKFADIIQKNYDQYFTTKEKPMPFFLGVPKQSDGGWLFNWDPAFDLQGQGVEYSIEIASDSSFKNILYKAEKLYGLSALVYLQFQPGTYYWKVLAKDSDGNMQTAYDYTRLILADGRSEYHFGVKKLVVQ